jgi:uncharacterized protein (DUF2062 family)
LEGSPIKYIVSHPLINKQIRKIKFLLIKLLRIKDNAHSIALGFTVGLIINFVPSFGFGPLLSTAGAKILRGNPLAGFIGGISIIWAFPILFYLNYLVGEIIYPVKLTKVGDSLDNTDEALEVGLQLGQAFFIGMGINVIVFCLITYPLVFYMVKKYRGSVLYFIHKKWKI